MQPFQSDLLAQTALADRRRDALRWRTARPASPAWRTRAGDLLLGVAELVERAGRRLQRPQTESLPCACAQAR